MGASRFTITALQFLIPQRLKRHTGITPDESVHQNFRMAFCLAVRAKQLLSGRQARHPRRAATKARFLIQLQAKRALL